MAAFQRFHNSSRRQSDAARQYWSDLAEHFWSQPDFMHATVEKATYATLDATVERVASSGAVC
eukprot:421391-Prymnesium_polylepis.1